jgi:hypothetical protein
VTQESVGQHDRAEALISEGKQLLKQAALDFGMQFARSLRQDIETLTKQLQESLMQGDEAHIEQHFTNLQTKLDELNQEMLQLPPPIF